MKNVFKTLGAALLLTLVSFSVFSTDTNSVNLSTEKIQEDISLGCKYDQCHATAKSTGKRCRHCVSNQGDLYCWQHR